MYPQLDMLTEDDTTDLITTLKYFCKPMETKGVFSTWNHDKCLSQLFPLHLYTYVMGLRRL